MLRYTSILVSIVLAIAGPSAAVVHGIQSLSSGRFESSDGNRNGYRYNGPAHKYLPAASEPTTEAVITTGYWQPNPLPPSYTQPSFIQQLPYELSYNSTPATGRPYQQSNYNGPYSTQHYEPEPEQQHHHQLTSSYSTPSSSRQQHNNHNYINHMNTFQYAANHQAAGAPATGIEFSQAFGISADTQHDRHMEPGQRAAPLIGQALPERYQRQPFVDEQQPASSFVQMQSHSYELPPTYNMQADEWLQHLSATPPAPAPAQQEYHNRELEQANEYVVPYPDQGQAYGQYSQSSPFSTSSFHPSSSGSGSSSSSSFFHASHAHSASAASTAPQTSYLTLPSREFQAPYF
ncbi:uncharacterized protein LOC6565236 [Drosophila grimshawi]|uniref:GH12589 n=1 Tax=Drosophila grimshawi TaxID=7222 RepID=B4JK47_DROGR|nr:uncharacterized protein LOC6565236 [Drosophila grimshawi]EDV99949.1 GH12589 [Drosophila grimshawi]